MDPPWIRRRARSAADGTRTPLLARPPHSTPREPLARLDDNCFAGDRQRIARKLEGSHRRRVASRQPPLHLVGTADLRGRAALRPSSLDGHPTRCDGRCARHPRVDRPAAHAGDGGSSPTFASASGCSLDLAAAPTRRQLRLPLGSHLRRDRHRAHPCPARGPRACPRATPARARPTPTGVRAARATARPPGLHRGINPAAGGCDRTAIAAGVFASWSGPRVAYGAAHDASDAIHLIHVMSGDPEIAGSPANFVEAL